MQDSHECKPLSCTATSVPLWLILQIDEGMQRAEQEGGNKGQCTTIQFHQNLLICKFSHYENYILQQLLQVPGWCLRWMEPQL